MLNNEFKEFNIDEYNFMPYIELIYNSPSEEVKNIANGDLEFR